MTARALTRPFAAAVIAALVLSLGALLPGAAPTARADGFNTGRTAPSMLVMDGSGSMREQDVDGRSRMEVAQEAITALVPMLPEDATVGLMTYGNSAPGDAADAEQGCQDIKLLVEPTGLDRDALLGAVAGIVPSGYTPIGLSLQRAAEALPAAEMRSIVLVSDGIDECGGAPACQVAADLSDQHPELRIHTIGFKAEQAARDELACIAAATGGTYADATDSETLRDELLVRMTRAIQGYASQGSPITGGTSVGTAVEMTPGSHLDVLEHGSPAIDDGEGFSRYYQVQLAPGEIAHLSATIVLTGGDGVTNRLAQLRLRTLDADGADCRVGEVMARSEADLGQGPLSAGISTPRMGETDSLACFGQEPGGAVIVQVERTGDPALQEAVPVEVQFFAEEQVDPGGMPPGAEFVRPLEPLPVPADGQPISPAFSFASAVPAAEGPVRGTIIPGEVQFFRIPVQYGQQLQAALALGAFEAPAEMDLTLRAAVISPLREGVYTAVPPLADASATGSAAPATPGATMQLNQATPVQFRNRESGGTEARTAFLAGEYYLQLAVVPSSYSADRLFEIPYVLDLHAAGEVADGPALTGQGAASASDRLAADPGAALSDGGGASDAGGSEPAGPEELEDPPARSERFTLPPLAWVVLAGLGGGIAVGAAVIGVLTLVRRGR